MLDTPAAVRVVQLAAKQLFMMFPTPMFTGMLPDIGLCDRIEKKLREVQKSGKGFPSPGGMILAYMTPDDIQTLPEVNGLVEVIMAESSSILDFYAIKRDSHYITNMWANIANPNRRHNFRLPAHSFEEHRTDLFQKERVQRRYFLDPAGEGPHVDLAQPRSACGRARHRRRSRGPDCRGLQRHDSRADRSAHGAFGFELTDFSLARRRHSGARA